MNFLNKAGHQFVWIYPMNFELPQGGQGVRPMSVDRLRDAANTRSQCRRNLKGEGYTREELS
ncbi:hypothetical protein [Candidatus Regiella endosymbiont of Tuberolachnus salignus]|uniref:hypothetical protein n=1 Tax=Candidatus Regiella endosymbiont of Tuberolachnus salignus TaxID=3077956 RepID=UPI0030D030DA